MPYSPTWLYAPQENSVLFKIHATPLKGQNSYKSLEIQSKKDPCHEISHSISGNKPLIYYYADEERNELIHYLTYLLS